MALLKLSSNRFLLFASVLWLLCVSSQSARAQVQWSCMPVQFNSHTRTLFVDSSDSTLYVGGLFRTANNQPDTAIIGIRPDGTIKHFPDPHIIPVIVIGKWQGKLLAGGGGGLAEYDGTAWRKIDSSGVVVALYPYDGKLLMGGSFTDPQFPSNVAHALMEWDGNTAQPFKGLDSITRGQGVYSIIEYNGDLIIAGNLLTYPPVDPRFKDILRWTGTSWQLLGNVGLPGGGLDEVADMEVVNGELYVAGYFRESSGSPGNSVARWDGTAWHKLAGTAIPSSGVYELELQGDTLIFTGNFGSANGSPAYSLTRYWNGHWCNNDHFLNNGASSAINYFGEIVVTGGFTTVGTDTCGYLAKVTSWGDCFAQATASISAAQQSISGVGLSAYPNPASDDVRVEFSSPRVHPAIITLSDATGRIIRTHAIKTTEGLNRVTMHLSGVPAGLYFLQLASGTGNETIKLVKQ